MERWAGCVGLFLCHLLLIRKATGMIILLLRVQKLGEKKAGFLWYSPGFSLSPSFFLSVLMKPDKETAARYVQDI